MRPQNTGQTGVKMLPKREQHGLLFRLLFATLARYGAYKTAKRSARLHQRFCH